MHGHMNLKVVTGFKVRVIDTVEIWVEMRVFMSSVFFTHMNVLQYFNQRIISFSNYDILYWDFGKNSRLL
jgi:hypothetical protein